MRRAGAGKAGGSAGGVEGTPGPQGGEKHLDGGEPTFEQKIDGAGPRECQTGEARHRIPAAVGGPGLGCAVDSICHRLTLQSRLMEAAESIKMDVFAPRLIINLSPVPPLCRPSVTLHDLQATLEAASMIPTNAIRTVLETELLPKFARVFSDEAERNGRDLLGPNIDEWMQNQMRQVSCKHSCVPFTADALPLDTSGCGGAARRRLRCKRDRRKGKKEIEKEKGEMKYPRPHPVSLSTRLAQTTYKRARIQHSSFIHIPAKKSSIDPLVAQQP